ncbi:zinc-binding dehydrogenase [Vibrio parahaemolyticus]|uniref:zinc-binding dehydrogenase n=1 Tax=Vibrio parahaemolyticus TaxID=670 RepID=UPI00038E4FEF|nr:zinc-binding dehydrogenase [Vibrio parahaemolyticus]EJG0922033.1 zinc-binding dehydrogenase [Vibrio parahaemolyticus O1:K68]EJG0931579.1 zinc-binding dehydrogenase [Vibrio parahaemolyticus O1]EJG0945860.1 zinc-binding dehydrogenase [Vibrio parahaemolyticus O10]EQM49462.1 zinc-binding dehydrogenase family protein [Vibrio parahaemolyticus VPCR-2010]EGQ9063764.1 zinc-binding dehydrogenase [Vibrio parahaemolyticus]
MKASIYHQFGEPSEVLNEEETSLPSPGFNQVRVKTILSPIHNHDLWTVRGKYGHKPNLPAIGGSEALGIIDAVGEGVKELTPGQRVVGSPIMGVWAEYFLAPAEILTVVPDTVSDEVGAQLGSMPFSALLLLEFLNAKAGQWIIQNAAGGAIGKTLSILAREQGVNTISLVRDNGTKRALAAQGIEYVVSTDNQDWQQRVNDLTDGTSISYAIDSVGGSATAALTSLLGENGLLVSFGSMSGEAMHIPAADIAFKQITVKGFWQKKINQSMAVEKRKSMMEKLICLAETGKLKLPVDSVYPMNDVKNAVTASLQSSRKGKVMLRP